MSAAGRPHIPSMVDQILENNLSLIVGIPVVLVTCYVLYMRIWELKEQLEEKEAKEARREARKAAKAKTK